MRYDRPSLKHPYKIVVIAIALLAVMAPWGKTAAVCVIEAAEDAQAEAWSWPSVSCIEVVKSASPIEIPLRTDYAGGVETEVALGRALGEQSSCTPPLLPLPICPRPVCPRPVCPKPVCPTCNRTGMSSFDLFSMPDEG